MPPEAFVHVVDDDEAIRDALAALLMSADMQVRTYARAQEFLDRGRDAESGCVITDVNMPDMTGLELLRRLRELGARFPVIVLTGEADVAMAVEALKIGAADFIEKPFAAETVLAAARSALRGAEQQAARDSEAARAAERIAALSVREQEVLRGLVAGQSNKMVAQDLGISPRTVEVYRANIMLKLQAASLSELVRIAIGAEQRS